MKIGIDIRCLADGKRTGVEEYTVQLLEHLFLHDRKNTYILFLNAWKKSELDVEWVKKYPHVSLRTFRFPNKILNFCLWYFRYPKLDRLIGGVDAFFMPNLNFSAFSSHVKVYVTAHDLSFERYPETFSWKRRFWHAFVNFRSLCRRADYIFAVSESTKNDLMEIYGVPSRKIVAVLSGVSERFHVMDRNNPTLLEVKEKYHLPYRFILYLGTIEPRKNVIALIQAYNHLQRMGDPELRKYALVIAGSRGWKYTETFLEIERSEFRDTIIVTDFVADEDKPALYNLASVFVYPSFFEGFGLPPAEAMRCGVPVIVSATSSFPEVVGSAGIMIDPYQPDELMKAMKEVLLHKDFREMLRERGLKRAQELQWSKVAETVMRYWEQ